MNPPQSLLRRSALDERVTQPSPASKWFLLGHLLLSTLGAVKGFRLTSAWGVSSSRSFLDQKFAARRLGRSLASRKCCSGSLRPPKSLAFNGWFGRAPLQPFAQLREPQRMCSSWSLLPQLLNQTVGLDAPMVSCCANANSAGVSNLARRQRCFWGWCSTHLRHLLFHGGFHLFRRGF